jgi:hypothetical protein
MFVKSMPEWKAAEMEGIYFRQYDSKTFGKIPESRKTINSISVMSEYDSNLSGNGWFEAWMVILQ